MRREEISLARKILIAGNWKMNGLSDQIEEVRKLSEGSSSAVGNVDILVCPPATLLRTVRDAAHSNILVGAQNCHAKEKGAHTGDISAEMLRDAGASHVIVGHSERRADHGECCATVRGKLEAAHRAGLTAIVCIGETLEEREAGEALSLLERQLQNSLHDNLTADNTIIAYEPIWAIGTGKTASAGDVAEVHSHLRRRLVERFGPEIGAGLRLLYGGSVQPANAASLFSVTHVDGALGGGASLKAQAFLAICEAARSCR